MPGGQSRCAVPEVMLGGPLHLSLDERRATLANRLRAADRQPGRLSNFLHPRNDVSTSYDTTEHSRLTF